MLFLYICGSDTVYLPFLRVLLGLSPNNTSSVGSVFLFTGEGDGDKGGVGKASSSSSWARLVGETEPVFFTGLAIPYVENIFKSAVNKTWSVFELLFISRVTE